jgi:hypothetical protein
MSRRDDHGVSHGEAVACILNSVPPHEWSGPFAAEMRIVLCVPVILERFFNPKILLKTEFWEQTRLYGPSPRPVDGVDDNVHIPIESVKLHNLAKFPDFIRDPEFHFFEIKTAYQELRADSIRLRKHLTKLSERTCVGITSVLSLPSPRQRLHVRYQATYSVLLTMATILNGILRAFEPHDLILAEESVTFPNEIMALAEQASPYRPLGSSYMPLCLIAAWAVTNDLPRRVGMEKMLAEYQKDFASANWMEYAIWLRHRLETLHTKLSLLRLETVFEGCDIISSAGADNAEEII